VEWSFLGEIRICSPAVCCLPLAVCCLFVVRCLLLGKCPSFWVLKCLCLCMWFTQRYVSKEQIMFCARPCPEKWATLFDAGPTGRMRDGGISEVCPGKWLDAPSASQGIFPFINSTMETEKSGWVKKQHGMDMQTYNTLTDYLFTLNLNLKKYV